MAFIFRAKLRYPHCGGGVFHRIFKLKNSNIRPCFRGKKAPAGVLHIVVNLISRPKLLSCRLATLGTSVNSVIGTEQHFGKLDGKKMNLRAWPLSHLGGV